MKIENKNHKDTVFRALYRDRARLLELYNALNGTNYNNPDNLIIKTLKGITFLGMKNDVSFIIDYEINLYEHNSTPCPNIPLRDLFYIASSYKKIVSLKSTYKESPIKIHVPRFFMFYNGASPLPDRYEYKLSDMFIKETPNPSLELKVTVLNINEGHNKSLMDSCNTLKDYSLFVSKVRKYTQKAKLEYATEYYKANKDKIIEEAVIKSIDECIEEGILRNFFIENRKEAIEMSKMEVTAEEYYEVVADENYEKGVEQGISQGISQGIADLTALNSWLFSAGRDNDVKRASTDPDFLDLLFKEYAESHKNS